MILVWFWFCFFVFGFFESKMDKVGQIKWECFLKTPESVYFGRWSLFSSETALLSVFESMMHDRNPIIKWVISLRIAAVIPESHCPRRTIVVLSLYSRCTIVLLSLSRFTLVSHSFHTPLLKPLDVDSSVDCWAIETLNQTNRECKWIRWLAFGASDTGFAHWRLLFERSFKDCYHGCTVSLEAWRIRSKHKQILKASTDQESSQAWKDWILIDLYCTVFYSILWWLEWSKSSMIDACLIAENGRCLAESDYARV